MPAHDVTTTTETCMQLTPETEAANRYHLVSRLADDLAHEIKNPLNSLVINLEVLRSRARKGDADGVLGRADVLEIEVRRLNTLLDGLLRLLRPDRQPGVLISVDTLVAEAAELAEVQARLARKTLSVSPVGDAAVTSGRRDVLRFALLNLLMAELDAVDGGAARVEVAGRIGESGTVLTIATVGGDPVEAGADGVDVACALIVANGGSVDVTPRGKARDRVITVVLPGARSA
ncbi:MAG TPA: histidine kinase dimerization/phospho-acceptor domain-containing protein [Longimicrobiales bacterium]